MIRVLYSARTKTPIVLLFFQALDLPINHLVRQTSFSYSIQRAPKLPIDLLFFVCFMFVFSLDLPMNHLVRQTSVSYSSRHALKYQLLYCVFPDLPMNHLVRQTSISYSIQHALSHQLFSLLFFL